ncbi:MAG: hypothetical protein MUF08_08565 [Burkholderiaceae bacterium]|nr:hypothetical protein [Burkholderiaceae bacterium]MCU0965096.1 hypothetical protein [Burkholderiaceae bacterium]
MTRQPRQSGFGRDVANQDQPTVEPRDLETKAFTQCLGLIKRGVWKELCELLATDAAKGIAHPCVPADHLRHVPARGIACRMAPGVGDRLEVIQGECQRAGLRAWMPPQPLARIFHASGTGWIFE